jgi:hypothetical protein
MKHTKTHLVLAAELRKKLRKCSRRPTTFLTLAETKQSSASKSFVAFYTDK